MLNERKLTERELDKRTEAIQGLLSNKRTLVKKYGKDAEKVMYGIATKQAKNKVEGMNKDKIKELIQTALQKEETTSINESKGAKNYFDDLKFNYQKAFRFLDKDEKEEYKQLAKDFFSKLQEDKELDDYNSEFSDDEEAQEEMDNEDYPGKIKEADSKYPDFDLDKNIKYQDTSISSGMWRYTGKEQGGKGVYRNLSNDQFLGFSSDDFAFFKKHLGSHFDMSESLEEANIGLADLEEVGYTDGDKAVDMHFNQDVVGINSDVDYKSYRKGFIQGVIDSTQGFSLDERVAKIDEMIDYDESLNLRAIKAELEGEIQGVRMEMEDEGDESKADYYGDILNRFESRLAKVQGQLDDYDMNESVINEDSFENEIERLKDIMYVDDESPRQTIIHPLSKPGARRPDKSYIVIRGNNVEAIQGYGSGPIEDFAQQYQFPDYKDSSYDMGMEIASGKASLLSSNVLKDAIKAIEDARDVEAKRQSDYYKDRGPVSGVGNMDEMIKSIVKEKLTKSSSVEDHIDDFKDSDAKQFKGKSDDKKVQMAVASFLSKKNVNEAPAFQWRKANSPAGDTLKDLVPKKVGTSTVQENMVADKDIEKEIKKLEDENPKGFEKEIKKLKVRQAALKLSK